MFERNVTIYFGTQKRLAKRYTIEEPAFSMRSEPRVRFMEKGGRTRWWMAQGPNLVILDGWDHPEFEFLMRAFEDAPVQHLSPGVTYRLAEQTLCTRDGPVKDKYELEFEAYIKSLKPAQILFNTRKPGD